MSEMSIEEAKKAVVASRLDSYEKPTICERAAYVIYDDHARLTAALEASQRQVRELEEAIPDRCPITGLAYFCDITDEYGNAHHTYGGPFDSYTIPKLDEDGYFYRRRYDHDAGRWIDGNEITELILVDEQRLLHELHEDAASLVLDKCVIRQKKPIQ